MRASQPEGWLSAGRLEVRGEVATATATDCDGPRFISIGPWMLKVPSAG
jgi:hypothetical protein